jgi:hypothetical protein
MLLDQPPSTNLRSRPTHPKVVVSFSAKRKRVAPSTPQQSKKVRTAGSSSGTYVRSTIEASIPEDVADDTESDELAPPERTATQYEAFKFMVRQEPAEIDCVFWVPTDSGGMWRSLHDLPKASKTLFKKKFQQDYLDTIWHVHRFDNMVRHKNTYLKNNICVSCLVWGYQKKEKEMEMDRKTSCLQCTPKSRFCARLVTVGHDVKLGFFPVHGVDGSDVAWDRLEFWI